MSQRVAGIAVLCMVVSAGVYAQQQQVCTGQGTGTVNITGAAGSAVAPEDVLMKNDKTETAMASVHPVDIHTDPYPDGIFIFFVAKTKCVGALFPSDGGIYLGSNIHNGDKNIPQHMVVGRYCDIMNKEKPGDPQFSPRNIITIASTKNACPWYIGYADINTMQIVYDKENIPHMNRVVASFTVQCAYVSLQGQRIVDGFPVSGKIDYTASPQNKGSVKPTNVNAEAGSPPVCQAGALGSDPNSAPGDGGTGGSGSGGGTPAGPVGDFSFVLPDDVQQAPVVVSSSQPTSFDVYTSVANGFNQDVTLSVVTNARDSDLFDVNITPDAIAAPGQGKATVTITTHPLTFPRDYLVTLMATTADGTTYANTFSVSVLCDPPKILGTDQPQSQTLTGSAKAALKIKSAGSPPFSYQWYNGMTGMTNFPVDGATSDTLTTNQDGTYWVRVSNACGTDDSEPVTVSHQ